MVLLPENLFPKFLYEFMNLYYIHWFQLKVQSKKIRDGYRRAVEKKRNKQDQVFLKQNWQPVDISVYLDFCAQ